MKFDAHTTIGDTPPGRTGRTKPHDTASVEGLLHHFERFKITHACVYYQVKNLPLLQEAIARSSAFTKIYPIRWIDTYKEEIAPFDCGVKLHPNRGLAQNPFSLRVRKYIEDLPAGFKVFIHTQGSSSLKNVSRPQMIMNLACLCPDKTFIICHSGVYGFRSWLPVNKENMEMYNSLMIGHYNSRLLINEAIFVAKLFPNVYLESSYIVPNVSYKAEMLACMKDKLIFGSDYPFLSANEQSPEVWGETMKKFGGWNDEDVARCHQNALSLFSGL